MMWKQRENKTIAVSWLEGFWGNPWDPTVVDELAAPDILLQFLLHRPRRGRDEVKKFMIELREAFHELEFHSASELVAEGDYVVGHCEGGGTHTGPAFIDPFVGFLPANSGQKMRLRGSTILRISNGTIAEEMTRLTWATNFPKGCCAGNQELERSQPQFLSKVAIQ
jgi:SnoaL-like polyketide cyclase